MNKKKSESLPMDPLQESLPVNTIPGMQLWALPGKLAGEYLLTDGQVVKIRFGSLSAETKISILAGEGIALSHDILNQLKIPIDLRAGVKSEGRNKFRLGPVIGILTFRHVTAKKDFRRYIPYALRMKNIGLLYVFDSDSINSSLGIVKGYYYNISNETWQEEEFPFPDAVMDRTYPNNRKTHRKLEKFIGQNRIFNKKTLINKIDFYRALRRNNFLGNYVPETRIFNNTSDFKYMSKKYQSLYLKPVNGMKGKGIIQVMKTNNGLECRYISEKDLTTRIINRSGEIFDVLKCASNHKKTPYIIQSEILRMEYDQRVFGFRIMAVKNGNGHWSVPAIFTKITEPAGFLTNTSAGARIILFKELLDNIEAKLPYPKKQLAELLSDLSIKTADSLDKKFGPLGKLGIDIVLDQSGKPWLIEANGNPGLMPKIALGEYPDWHSQMYDLPLAYCLYLSGFNHLKNLFTGN